MRRWIRVLLVVAIVATYVGLVARLAWTHPQVVGGDASILEGVSQEALAGTTPGRQALVGSAWWGPLPLALHLAATTVFGPLRSPGGLLAGVPLAVWLSGLFVIVACLWAVRHRSLSEGLQWNGRRPPVFPLALAAVLPAALSLAAGGMAQAVVAPLALFLVIESAAWLATGQLRHLVPSAFAMAALLLCGVTAWGWVAFGAAAMVLGALPRKALARRLPGLLLLGWLPAVYALGVWALLNWLIMGDTLFFLRPLATLSAAEWPALAVPLSSVWDQAAFIICGAGAVLGLAARDGRRVGYGLAGIAAVLWLWVLHAFGLAWAAAPTRWMLYVGALLSLTRLSLAVGVGHPRRGLALQTAVVLLVLVSGALRGRISFGVEPPTTDDGTVARVAEHALARSAYARVFVCGYEGLGLLRGDRRNGLFVPVLDLHLNDLRRDYWGQTLFVLVHKPIRAARLESIVWREPDFHWLGSSRTLLSADFDAWRLYEVVTAPTQHQLARP